MEIFLISGIALLLLGVAILAWWLISTDLIESRQTLSNVYLQSLRRTDSVSYRACSFRGQFFYFNFSSNQGFKSPEQYKQVEAFSACILDAD